MCQVHMLGRYLQLHDGLHTMINNNASAMKKIIWLVTRPLVGEG